MNKFILAVAVFFTNLALAGTDPSDTFRLGNGSPTTDKKIIINQGTAPYPALKWNNSSATLQFSNDGTNFSDLGSGSGSGQGFNVLTNPDFESGVVLGFTHSGGTLTAATSGPNLLLGKGSAVFTASGASQTFTSSTYSIPNGLKGRACSVATLYLGGSANLSLQAFDGTSILATAALPPVTTPTTVAAPFVCPSSGNFQWRVVSSGSAPATAFDTAFLGQNVISQVSQATFFASAHFAAGGALLINSGSTILGLNTFAVSSGSPNSPTLLGNATSASGSTGSITLSNVPPGNYQVIYQGGFRNNAPGGIAFITITDSVTAQGWDALGQGSNDTYGPGVQGLFQYQTAQSSVTFQPIATNTNGAVLNGTDGPWDVYVYRFPSQSEIAVAPETINWRIQVSNVLGANLFTTTQSDSDFNVSGMQLGNYSGSDLGIPTYQTCAGTEAAHGTSCSGNADIGVSFLLPAAQTVRACVSFTYFTNTNSSAGINPTIVETPNNAQTVLQRSTESQQYNNNPSAAIGFLAPMSWCHDFVFTSAGQKTLRLFGDVNAASTNGGFSPATGAAIATWQITPITQNVPAPVLIGQPVAFHVADGAPTGSLPNGSALNIAIWGSVGTSSGGFDTNNGYSTSTGLYTVPVAGLWYFSCHLGISSTVGTDFQFDAILCKNGTGSDCTSGVNIAYALIFYDGTTTGSHARYPQTSIIRNFNVGETVGCYGLTNVAGTWAGDHVNNFFEGHLLRN
jgi:hypothetical protein